MTTEQRRLWKQAFGDTDVFLDIFGRTAYAPDRCHTVTADGQLAAALYWLDCEIAGEKAAYIYAVATDPALRGKGYCRRLMTETHAILRQRGYASALLVPGEPSLVAMYEKMGYRVATAVTRRTVAAGQPVSLRPLDAAAYAARRRQLLPPDGVVQEGENLRLLAVTHLLFEGANCLAAVRREGDTAVFAELLGEPTAAAGFVAALGCRDGRLWLPEGDTPYALWLPLVDGAAKPGYFGWSFE